MNRSLKDSLIGGRNTPVGSQHRRGLSLNGISRDTDENLDLFSRNRRSLSVASSDESDVSVKLGRLSAGSAKLARSGLDDLLSSTDGGKHDYDWLLTPPGTPLFPSSDGSESQPASAAPKSSSLVRSVSTTKASRLSVSQSESNNHHSRPTRSSSVTRPSISSTQYSTYSNKSTSILNTSSASVSSYIRPFTPVTRSSSTTRPSTPSARPTPSRSSTPSKVRSVPTSSSIDKSRPSSNSRPSTPSSRPQIPANLISQAARSASRPTTPTRRSTAPSVSPAAGLSTSVGRILSNGRNAGPASRPSSPRPSSPSPRVRPPPQPMVLPDFPLDIPPNLRTTLPDRPLSAGRSRPGVALTVKGNIETPTPANLPRRQSSPIVTRGRLTEPTGRGRAHTNGQAVDPLESRKATHVSESSMRKPVKSSTTSAESTGFGRTISKKSLDMAIRHMDIKNGTSGIRPLSGTTLFPQSIRSTNPKSQPGRAFSAPAFVNGNLSISTNGVISENGNYVSRSPDNGTEEDNCRFSAKLCEADIYESSRYDAILLKEDLKNTNWLHSVDDKSDQGPIFDNGFEHLPEPFGPL
uniref:Putative GPI-anchored protein PB15E9.01c n=2 Tax=Davidia involucrata TaxID=16924 RepID=A0A5B7AFL4_DAVIN